MSDIQRRIVTIFETRGANQIRAMLGEMRTGFGGFRRELAESDRSARQYGTAIGTVDKQLRALGTTLRYSVAGGAIFGGFTAVRNLTQIQEQLGLISAISPTAFGGFALAGEQLTQFGEQAEDAAYRALTTITEFNDGLVNLVSTVQDVPQNQVVPILEQIAQVAKTAQTPVQELTKGISSMLVAFNEPVTLDTAQTRLAQYQAAIYNVPGGVAAGPQIIQQLPQLAAVSRRANITPDEMFALLETSLRSSGNPATAIRGLQYLLDTIASGGISGPAKQQMRSIGVTAGSVQQEGGVINLFRLIEAVRTRGVRGNVAGLKGIDEETLLGLEGATNATALTGLGISGAGAEFAQTATGRIHATRALVSLLSRNDTAREDLRSMIELGADHAEAVDQLNETWKRFEDRAQLRKTATAIDQMAVDIAQVFEPVLNFAGVGVQRLRDIIDRNPELAVGAGAAGISGLMLARRLGRGGLLRSAGGVMAVKDVAEGIGNPNIERGSSPTNPIWVAVAFSLSGPGAGGMFGRRGGPATPRGTGGGATAGRRGLPPIPLAAKGIAGAVGASFFATDLVDEYIYDMGFDPSLKNLRKRVGKKSDWTDIFSDPTNLLPGKGWLWGRGGNKNGADRLFGGGRGNAGDKQLNLRAKGEMTINIDGLPGGRQKRTVPFDLYPDFTQPAPTTRGKPTTYRGGP